MKALKILLIIIIIIGVAFGLLMIYGSTQPHELTLERSITIDASPEMVFDVVNDLKTWDNWSSWNLSDSTMQITYSGSESGEGMVSTWTSENSGSGSQTITESIPYSSIKTDLDFGSQGSAKSTWKFEEASDGTKVTWGFIMDTGNAFSRAMISMFFDAEKMVGSDYEKGLVKLKEYIENMPKEEPMAPEPMESDSTMVTQ